MKSLMLVLGLMMTFIYLRASAADENLQIIDSLEQVLQKSTNPDTARVNLLNNLGYRYWIINPVRSVAYGSEALALADSLDYLSGVAFARRVIGVANWSQGNYEEGLIHLMDALVKYQDLNDTLGIANVLMNTGLIYSEQHSFDEALAYYQEAYRTFELLQKTDRQLHTAIHIGELYQAEENYVLALQYFERAQNLSDSINHSYGLASSNLHLGQLSLAMGNLDRALTYCRRALPMQEIIGDGHGKSLTYHTLGSIQRELGNFQEAQNHLLKAVEEATKVSSKQNLRDIYLELKKVAQSTGNYQQALSYLETYTALQDSLLNAEKLREIVHLESKYELEKKEQELLVQQQSMALMQQEAKIQSYLRNGLIIGIVVLALIGYLITSRQRLKIKKNQEVLAKNQEIFHSNQALAQAELENARLKQNELAQELDYKNKELTSYTVNFIQKNELMEHLKDNIQQLQKNSRSEVKQQLTSLSRLVDQNLHIDREWEDFKRHFEEVHIDFFTNLKQRCPELSSNELKLCALLRLNMTMKEMSSVLGISPDSVKTARYRLRKKLGLEREESLVDFILNIEKMSTPTDVGKLSSQKI